MIFLSKFVFLSLRVCLKILVFVERTKFPFATPYFSCLDTRKVTKESQEILNSPTAQTIGFRKTKY
ncbi:hypothetical protein BWI92_01775 [Flectobacillus sp. BAB-3569]|nr:hypothetical protein BWI92_01775 [Flectobacillus sp. BAB-3569]